MTGFGRGETITPNGKIEIEIRTLNHRFFEVSSRLPENFLIFEDRLRSEVAKKIKRGKVNLSLAYDKPRRSGPKLVINKDLAHSE